VSDYDDIALEPWRHDLFSVMRRIERDLGSSMESHGEISMAPARSARPRIGDSASRSEERLRISWRNNPIEAPISFGQDPWMAFPASNIYAVERRGAAKPARADEEKEEDSAPERLHIVTRFLGLLGAQGPLPIHTTEETRGWIYDRDKAFAHFLDIFNNRFIQLFFRAWGDSRPIVHNDRPELDRFRAYLGSMIGVGAPAFEHLPALPPGLAHFAGLLGPKAKSASRLSQTIHGLFGVDAEIEEFVGSWLEFEPQDRSLLGSRNGALGVDFVVGAASFSVLDKIRLRLFVANLPQYLRFLPNGADCDRLVDLMYFYIGDELDWDVELALPARCAEALSLGGGAKLGWTSWIAPEKAPDYGPDAFRCDARFHPAERKRQERERVKRQKGATT
jgi:type VI secretion system protein ImpH